jgi:L-lactate dehydrogenase complex protein LldG
MSFVREGNGFKMTASARDAFLRRVQEALQAGNRPGDAAEIPPRGDVGYQGAGPDPVARFRDELTTAGGQPHLVPDAGSAVQKVLELVQAKAARTALLGQGSFIDQLGLVERLAGVGVKATTATGLSLETSRETFFTADIGITGVDYLIAETGSVVVLARPAEPRSFSLLPPFHIAVAHRDQIVPDLFDLFARLGAKPADGSLRVKMPSCVSLITGPSKTGDIELKLVTGVHGPGEIHVVVVTG